MNTAMQQQDSVKRKEHSVSFLTSLFVGQVEENLMSYLGQTLAPKMVKKKKKDSDLFSLIDTGFNKEVMKILKELSQLT